MESGVPSPENRSSKKGQGRFTHEPVWVQCEGYRCLAIMDDKGRWRSFGTGKELSEVVKVIADQAD